jgi:K+-transporting ATPase A subunit
MALGLARIVRALAGLIALVIVVAIVLFVLGANQSNGIVSAIHDAGAWLVGPFKNLFSIHKPKLAMAVNWGLAALVYLIVGHFIASLLVRMTPRRRAVAV